MVTTFAAVLALVAYIIGASFVGAEWSSGGMMNLLLRRPQRLRVLGTKLAALLVFFTALTVVFSAVWTGVFYLIAQARGTTESMTHRLRARKVQHSRARSPFGGSSRANMSMTIIGRARVPIEPRDATVASRASGSDARHEQNR